MCVLEGVVRPGFWKESDLTLPSRVGQRLEMGMCEGMNVRCPNPNANRFVYCARIFGSTQAGLVCFFCSFICYVAVVDIKPRVSYVLISCCTTYKVFIKVLLGLAETTLMEGPQG